MKLLVAFGARSLSASVSQTEGASKPMTSRFAATQNPLQVGVLGVVKATLLALALVAQSCGNRTQSGRAATADSVSLNAAGAEWDRLFNSRDAVGLADLYAEDVISMPFSAPTTYGRQALKADFERFFSQNTGRHETMIEEILAADDWAIERARYTLTYSPLNSGREIKETGRHVMCRKKMDGQWQIAWELWNTDTSPSQ